MALLAVAPVLVFSGNCFYFTVCGQEPLYGAVGGAGALAGFEGVEVHGGGGGQAGPSSPPRWERS
jgi:hypothetical protein